MTTPAASNRLLAVDFGEKRIGLAVSQGSLALPLATLARRSDAEAVAEIAAVAREEGVTGLVVGEPRRLDGTAGDAARRVHAFARRLQAATGLPCALVDEALTSRAAEERLRAAGVDPRRHPERVDQVAAQLLLEEVLAREERARAASAAAPSEENALAEEGE
jgi:putative pre-16S rRNA nuclease